MENEIQFVSLSPNLIVADVNQSVKFYTENLGFSLMASVPESGPLNWAMVMRNGVTVMFQSLRSLQEDLPSLGLERKGGIGTFYVKVKGLDQLFDSIKATVEIVVKMRTTFYGAKEFAIKDPDGYILMFAEDLQ